jgi:hypothetical protein
MTVSSMEITLDVFENHSSDLRRRLREQPDRMTASMLPGGMILEDRAEELVYRLGGSGDWKVETMGAAVVLRSTEGVEINVRDGQVTLHLPKL